MRSFQLYCRENNYEVQISLKVNKIKPANEFRGSEDKTGAGPAHSSARGVWVLPSRP